MKFLAIDFGEKRIGLATSDASGRIATPRETLKRSSDARAIGDIVAFLRREEIDEIVIGVPRRADGSDSPLAPRARSFARKLGEASGLPVRTLDEHLTSWEAQSRKVPGGPSPRRSGLRPRDGGLDAAAAAVILEDYLAGREH